MTQLKNQFVSIIALCCFGIIAYASSDEAEQVKKDQKEEKIKSLLEVDAEQIALDYENNEIAADEKYEDKIITVNGVVGEVNKDILGNYSLELEISTVQMFICKFSEDKKEKLSKLTKGQKVKIQGKFSKTIYLDMDDCDLI